MEVLRESYDIQKYLPRKGLSLGDCTHKMNAFIAFLINERDALVKQSIERAIKICEEQEIPIEERRIRRKKMMPGEHAEDVGLSAIEEIKRCMLEAMDRFRSKAEKRFSEMCLLNEVFGFLNPHTLLRSDSIEIDIGKFEQMYADDVNFTELKLEIARFNRLVQCSGFTFNTLAPARHLRTLARMQTELPRKIFLPVYLPSWERSTQKKIQLQTTSRMLEGFFINQFLLGRDARKQ